MFAAKCGLRLPQSAIDVCRKRNPHFAANAKIALGICCRGVWIDLYLECFYGK